jgi:hypothetical protein
MLNYKHQNIHHSKLPPPGAVGFVRGLNSVNPGIGVNSQRKCLISHYPLTDSPDYRFSLGIHTVYVRFLDNGEIGRFSGVWFEEADVSQRRQSDDPHFQDR